MVETTNEDATECKLSAVNCGYYEDEFLKFFVPENRRKNRKPPLINRGHFARVAAVDCVIRRFIERGGKQVVVLGAGYDTTYFRLGKERREGVAWFEIDFPNVISTKISTIERNAELRHAVGDVEPADVVGDGSVKQWKSCEGTMTIAGTDIRNTTQVEMILKASGIEWNEPTMIISEVVLVYIEPKSADEIISWAAKKFQTAVFVTYEQIRPKDAFGAMMVKNLEARGCPLLGIHAYPDLPAQEARYTLHGWQKSKAIDMNSVFTQLISSTPGMAKRLSSIEIFDELEEWNLIQAHYCFVISIIEQQHHHHQESFWGSQISPKFEVRLDLPESVTSRKKLPLA